MANNLNQPVTSDVRGSAQQKSPRWSKKVISEKADAAEIPSSFAYLSSSSRSQSFDDYSIDSAYNSTYNSAYGSIQSSVFGSTASGLGGSHDFDIMTSLCMQKFGEQVHGKCPSWPATQSNVSPNFQLLASRSTSLSDQAEAKADAKHRSTLSFSSVPNCRSPEMGNIRRKDGIDDARYDRITSATHREETVSPESSRKIFREASARSMRPHTNRNSAPPRYFTPEETPTEHPKFPGVSYSHSQRYNSGNITGRNSKSLPREFYNYFTGVQPVQSTAHFTQLLNTPKLNTLNEFADVPKGVLDLRNSQQNNGRAGHFVASVSPQVHRSPKRPTYLPGVSEYDCRPMGGLSQSFSSPSTNFRPAENSDFVGDVDIHAKSKGSLNAVMMDHIGRLPLSQTSMLRKLSHELYSQTVRQNNGVSNQAVLDMQVRQKFGSPDETCARIANSLSDPGTTALHQGVFERTLSLAERNDDVPLPESPLPPELPPRTYRNQSLEAALKSVTLTEGSSLPSDFDWDFDSPVSVNMYANQLRKQAKRLSQTHGTGSISSINSGSRISLPQEDYFTVDPRGGGKLSRSHDTSVFALCSPRTEFPVNPKQFICKRSISANNNKALLIHEYSGHESQMQCDLIGRNKPSVKSNTEVQKSKKHEETCNTDVNNGELQQVETPGGESRCSINLTNSGENTPVVVMKEVLFADRNVEYVCVEASRENSVSSDSTIHICEQSSDLDVVSTSVEERNLMFSDILPESKDKASSVALVSSGHETAYEVNLSQDKSMFFGEKMGVRSAKNCCGHERNDLCPRGKTSHEEIPIFRHKDLKKFGKEGKHKEKNNCTVLTKYWQSNTASRGNMDPTGHEGTCHQQVSSIGSANKFRPENKGVYNREVLVSNGKGLNHSMDGSAKDRKEHFIVGDCTNQRGKSDERYVLLSNMTEPKKNGEAGDFGHDRKIETCTEIPSKNLETDLLLVEEHVWKITDPKCRHSDETFDAPLLDFAPDVTGQSTGVMNLSKGLGTEKNRTPEEIESEKDLDLEINKRISLKEKEMFKTDRTLSQTELNREERCLKNCNSATLLSSSKSMKDRSENKSVLADEVQGTTVMVDGNSEKLLVSRKVEGNSVEVIPKINIPAGQSAPKFDCLVVNSANVKLASPKTEKKVIVQIIAKSTSSNCKNGTADCLNKPDHSVTEKHSNTEATSEQYSPNRSASENQRNEVNMKPLGKLYSVTSTASKEKGPVIPNKPTVIRSIRSHPTKSRISTGEDLVLADSICKQKFLDSAKEAMKDRVLLEAMSTKFKTPTHYLVDLLNLEATAKTKAACPVSVSELREPLCPFLIYMIENPEMRLLELTLDDKNFLDKIKRRLKDFEEEKLSVEKEIQECSHLGHKVTEIAEQKLGEKEFNKFKSFIDDLEKVQCLLLNLTKRLAGAENALHSLMPSSNDKNNDEKSVLVSKRDDLHQKYEDAKALSNVVANRRHLVADSLITCLSEDEFSCFQRFVALKTHLFFEKQALDDVILLLSQRFSQNHV